jgi:hypothetical protein
LGIRKMVCTLQRLINADFGRPQNGLHSWGVRRMVCTRWPSADWFALRDSMRTTSAPNLKRSCNENGCEKITKSAQIQSWQTNRVSQKWLSFLPLTNFDEFNFGVSSL